MTVNNPQSYPQPYGQQPFGQQQSGQMGTKTLNTGDAISIAWRHFSRQWVPWVLSMLAMMAIAIALYVSVWVIISETATTRTSTSIYDATQTSEPSGVGILAFIFAYIFGSLSVTFYTLNCYRNAFRMTQGETIAVGDFFKLSGLSNPLVVKILCGIITSIGTSLCIIPGFFAMFILMYVPVAAAINPNATVGNAFSEGLAAFKNNIGQAILFIILSCVIDLAGFLTLGMGTLAAVSPETDIAIVLVGSFFMSGMGTLVTVPLVANILVVGFLVATGRNLVVPD
ncbi:hypothetical protein [Corynebacterium durum]|uniref:hypothetical protein n=1 Tax=Corynebacterium durum TaxID=61592 RepID=UPI00402A2C9C